MSETSIAWTHYTFNPWWGCTRVSLGCEHCYAETFAKRLGLDLWGPIAARRFFSDRHWAEPRKWARLRAAGDPRHLVFCASMADVFEERPALDDQRARLWHLIEATPELTWQLLTKRPQNVLAMVPASWRDGFPPNVWMLTTAEDQAALNRRAPHLEQIPAVVRGLSLEPLLGPISFADGPADRDSTMGPWSMLDALQWVIVGGESGHGHRPMQLAWLDQIHQETRDAGVALFVKQDSGLYPGRQGRIPHDRWIQEFPTVSDCGSPLPRRVMPQP